MASTAASPEMEVLLENIETTLAAIKAGSVYHYTPQRVTRENLSYSELNVFPSYVIVCGPKLPEEYYGKRVKNMYHVYIRFFHTGEKGFDMNTKLMKMERDIRQALVQDVTRGGTGMNTEIVGVENDEGVIPPYIAGEMVVRISYLTLDTYR